MQHNVWYIPITLSKYAVHTKIATTVPGSLAVGALGGRGYYFYHFLLTSVATEYTHSLPQSILPG